jgi:hypothetical protein
MVKLNYFVLNLTDIKSKHSRDLIVKMLKANVADRITSSKVVEVLKGIKVKPLLIIIYTFS